MGNGVAEYLERLYASAPRALTMERALGGELSPDEWRRRLIAAVREALGEWPEQPQEIRAREQWRVKRPGYSCVKLTYDGGEGLETPAYLLLPDALKTPAPAMMACTGHGYGARDIVGIREDFSFKADGEDPGYQKNFAVALAERGYVVLAPEPLGFGELMLDGDEGNSCLRISGDMLLRGRTTLGARVRQFMAGISLLAGMAEVDASRIGAMGISGGGTVASFLTMLDSRVRAVVVSGYACMYRDSIYAINHCVDNFPFGLLNIAENDDLMALIAPRPMLWETGSRDPIFPRAGVDRAAASVARMYARLGRPEAFAVDRFEGDHEISGRLAYDFLDAALK